MIRSKLIVTVERPIEDVWRYLLDIERYTEWTDMTVSQRLDPGPLRVGSRARGQVALGPFKPAFTYEVTELEPMRRFSYRTIERGALGMDGTVEVSAEGPSRTRVSNEVVVSTGGVLRLLEPLMRGEIARKEAAETMRLKEKLEAGAAVQPPEAVAQA